MASQKAPDRALGNPRVPAVLDERNILAGGDFLGVLSRVQNLGFDLLPPFAKALSSPGSHRCAI